MVNQRAVLVILFCILFFVMQRKLNAQDYHDEFQNDKYDSVQMGKMEVLGVDYLLVHLNRGFSESKYMIAVIYERNDTLYIEKRVAPQRTEVFIFTDSVVIEYYESMLLNFSALEAKECKQFFEFLRSEDSWKKIGYSKNQWKLYYFFKQPNQNWHALKVAFKHRLFRFRCLSLKKNLRQRRIVKKFFKMIRIQDGLAYL